MTVLHQYSRLEAAGLWRSDPQAQARDVVVGLRKATIVLLDPKSEVPLTQWSLPAIQRLSQDQGRVTYAPHPDGYETLEIDDAVMIAALDRVRAVLDRRRRRPGRLRMLALAASLLGLLGGALAWVPMRLFDFTAQRLPAAVQRDLGAAVLNDLATISGSPCARPSGLAAAAQLSRRLTGAEGNSPDITILREGITAPVTLPGGTTLLPYALVEQVKDPDTLAGLVLAARLQAMAQDPIPSALRYAGIPATFHLLSTGTLPEGALQGYGLALARQTGAPADPAALAQALEQLQITPRPYAQFTGQTPPARATSASTPPVLDDAAFLALQYICD